MKQFLKRHRLLTFPLVFAVVAMIFSWTPLSAQSSGDTPPTPVIMEAKQAKAGENVQITLAEELPSTEKLSADELISRLKASFNSYDTALAEGNEALASTQLGSIYNYQNQVLKLLPILSAKEKEMFNQVCTESSGMLRANFYLLSESSVMDGRFVVAACEIIIGATA